MLVGTKLPKAYSDRWLGGGTGNSEPTPSLTISLPPQLIL